MSEARLHIDFETRSTCDLKVTGAEKYAMHPDTDVWLFSWLMEYPDGATVRGTWYLGDPLDPAVEEHIACGRTVVAHNAGFELWIWNEVIYKKYGLGSPIIPEMLDDTMARAYRLALPASLEGVGEALGLDVQKDMPGKRNMLKMARPRRIENNGDPVWWDDEEHIKKLKEYCDVDVDVECLVDAKLPMLPGREKRYWIMDRKINDRGVYLDRVSINMLSGIADEYKQMISNRINDATAGEVTSVQNATKLRMWLKDEHKLVLSDLSAATVRDTLKRDDLSKELRHVLTLRQEGSMNSIAKLKAMADSMCDDNRARGLFVYHAATTGRWAGRRIQPQNMFRPLMEPVHIEKILDDDLWAYESSQDRLAYIEGLLSSKSELVGKADTPAKVIASMLRSMIMAPPGHYLSACDYKQIEARVLPWLAGDEDKLQIFANDEDVYVKAAMGIYQLSEDEINDEKRFIGKIGELACGYQGGPDAYMKMAKQFGVDLTREFSKEIVDQWRTINKPIVKFWNDLQVAGTMAIKNPHRIYSANGNISFWYNGKHLIMRLPNGKTLTYPYAELARGRYGGLTIEFYGQDTYTRKWGRTQTYGGKLAENATQATAREIMADAMLKMDEIGMDIVMHVHDEIVVESKSLDTHHDMIELMSEGRAWTMGLPLAADGWSGVRYRK